MKYNMPEEMEKALSENDLGKSRSILVNSLLWGENEETIEKLEILAKESNVFEADNGESIIKEEDEALSECVDRIRTEVMLNFSKEKFEILKKYFEEYNEALGSSSEPINHIETKFIKSSKEKIVIHKDIKKKVAVIAIGLASIGLFIKLTAKSKSDNN